MAATVRSSSSAVMVASDQYTITIAEPAGTVQGDILFCVVGYTGANMTTPSGWTQVYAGSYGAGGTYKYWLGYVKRGASAPTLAMYASNSVATGSASVVSVKDGVLTSMAQANGTNGATTTIVPRAVTVPTAGSLVLAGGTHQSQSSTAWVAPTNYTVYGQSGSPLYTALIARTDLTDSHTPGSITGGSASGDSWGFSLGISGGGGPSFPATLVANTWVGTSGGDAQASDVNSSNDSYATKSVAASSISPVLTARNFGFAIPTTATINGIVVEVERNASGLSSIRDEDVFLTKDGTTNVGSDQAGIITQWPTGDTIAIYGSSTDLWGTTWTPAEINSTNFGLRFSVYNSAITARTASIDMIRITVHASISGVAFVAHRFFLSM